MKLIMLGAPGAGKGTHAEILSKRFSIPTISTGAIIRNQIRNETEIGMEAKKYIDAGQLVPDDIVIGLLLERLRQPDCKNGFILDGFPRTLNQAKMLTKMGIMIDKVVDLEVTEEEVIKRLSGRRECSRCARPYHIVHNPPKREGICDVCGGKIVQREDDTPETIKKRMAVYHKQTEPLKEYYSKEGLLAVVRSKDVISDTALEVMKVLGVSE